MDNVTLIRIVSGFLAFFIFVPLYFLPAFLARKKRQFIPVLLLNIFLGLTLIGWVGALIWAVTDEPKDQATSGLCSNCGNYIGPLSRFCSSCGHSLSPGSPVAR